MRLQYLLLPVLLCAGCFDHSPVDVTQQGSFPVTTFDITGGLVLSARVTVRGDTLRGTLYLQNPTSDTAWVDYGACSFGYRLYRSAGREGVAAYYDRLPGNAGCIDIGYRKGVLPSRQDSIVTITVQNQTLPNIPAGHYWFSLVTANSAGVKQFTTAGEGDVP